MTFWVLHVTIMTHEKVIHKLHPCILLMILMCLRHADHMCCQSTLWRESQTPATSVSYIKEEAHMVYL